MKACLCPVCNGSGKYCGKLCHGCSGKGWVEVREDTIPYSPEPWKPYSRQDSTGDPPPFFDSGTVWIDYEHT